MFHIPHYKKRPGPRLAGLVLCGLLLAGLAIPALALPDQAPQGNGRRWAVADGLRALSSQRASVAITLEDGKSGAPLSGAGFTLYQWDAARNARGRAVTQGVTDRKGKLTLWVAPGAAYELLRTGDGAQAGFSCKPLPQGVKKTEHGLLVTAGRAGSTLPLALANEAGPVEVCFQLVNAYGVPLSGLRAELFTQDPETQKEPAAAAVTAGDGQVKFTVNRGVAYYMRPVEPGGEPQKHLAFSVPVGLDAPTSMLVNGSSAPLSAAYQVPVETDGENWTLTVQAVSSEEFQPLAGARVALYAEEACATLIREEVTGEDGQASFPGLIVGVRYWLRENGGPQGYETHGQLYQVAEDAPQLTIGHVLAPVVDPTVSPSPSVSPDVSPSASPSVSPEASPSASVSPRPTVSPSPTVKPTPTKKPTTTPKPTATPKPTTTRTTPKTGDDTPVILAAFLGLGVLLAAMTLWRFLPRKKRGNGEK